MIDYIYGQDERLVRWALGRLPPNHQFRADAKTIGIEIDGKLRAVCVYDTFGTSDCLVTLVSDGSRRWMTREFAVRCMAFPFDQCKFKRISCLISVNNRRSIVFTQHFGGWVREGRMREAGTDGEDLIFYGMLRRDCRWLAPVNPLLLAV